MDLESLNDLELIQLSREGRKEESIAILYKRHFDKIFDYFCKLSSDYDLSNDLTQDTFLAVFSSLDDFKPDSSKPNGFRGYLYKSAYHHFVNQYRKNKRFPTHSLEDERIFLDKFPDSESSDYNLIRGESHKDLNKKILRLNNDLISILNMRYFDGLKYKEIAAKLNIPLGTVKSRISEGHHQLKSFYRVSRD